MDNLELLTLQQVIDITHRSRSSIYNDMTLDLFPKPLKIGRRSVRWRMEDIRKWYEKRLYVTT